MTECEICGNIILGLDFYFNPKNPKNKVCSGCFEFWIKSRKEVLPK